ncbi:unnamed protein product [Diplocarpon coronariae]
MPEVVEQQIQVPAPMSATNSGIEAEQPKPAAPMSTSGDDVGMRGGEYASCECCGCGCAEGCC